MGQQVFDNMTLNRLPIVSITHVYVTEIGEVCPKFHIQKLKLAIPSSL